jgi:hypothetical protein
MRFLLILLVACAALAAQAQSQARPRPPGTTTLEEPPPMPLVEADPAAARPQVTVRTEGDQEIAEYRIGGKLYMMRVTPKNGRPYTLIDQKGDGTFAKQDNTLTPHMLVPQWVLLEF